jgi:hypothetical protein
VFRGGPRGAALRPPPPPPPLVAFVPTRPLTDPPRPRASDPTALAPPTGQHHGVRRAGRPLHAARRRRQDVHLAARHPRVRRVQRQHPVQRQLGGFYLLHPLTAVTRAAEEPRSGAAAGPPPAPRTASTARPPRRPAWVARTAGLTVRCGPRDRSAALQTARTRPCSSRPAFGCIQLRPPSFPFDPHLKPPAPGGDSFWDPAHSIRLGFCHPACGPGQPGTAADPPTHAPPAPRPPNGGRCGAN